MSDLIVESHASPEIQAAAEKMGWIPPARFKGEPERFVDADIFVARGETVIPIIKAQNQKLQAELETLRIESQKTAQALREAQEAIQRNEERHTVATQKAVEQARKQLKQQLAVASEAGDHESVAEITDQLVQMRTDEKPAVTPAIIQPSAPVVDHALIAWQAQPENAWFETDIEKTNYAIYCAEQLRRSGCTLSGRAFYDQVTLETEKVFPAKETREPPDKMESSRNGSSGQKGGKKGYASLPADAKAACDADAKNFVGPKLRYKTAAEWQARYAELYYGD